MLHTSGIDFPFRRQRQRRNPFQAGAKPERPYGLENLMMDRRRFIK